MITKWQRRPRMLAPLLPDRLAGVYALFNGDNLIYIGRSLSIGNRVKAHARKRRFTHFTYKKLSPTKAYQVENLAIFRFKPKFNKHVMKPESIEQVRKGGKVLHDFRYRQGHSFYTASEWAA